MLGLRERDSHIPRSAAHTFSADIAQDSRGIANHQRVNWDILRHNCAGADHGPFLAVSNNIYRQARSESYRNCPKMIEISDLRVSVAACETVLKGSNHFGRDAGGH